METRAHHVLIGLFTVIVVAAALLFGLWLAKSSVDRKYKLYDVIFNEAVTGLSQGAAVQYNGIRVGSVAHLSLDPADSRRVLARIRLGSDTPVKTDTHAKLAITGVTGTAVIQLSGGSPDASLLQTPDDTVPIIVADPSPLAKLLANSEGLLSNVNEVMARAGQLLSDDNMQHIGRIIDHLDQATGAIAAERGDIRDLLKQLLEASRNANATLAQAQELIRQANGLVGGEGKATLASARAAMASLEHTTATVDRLLSDNRAALDGGLQNLGELGPAVRQLRESLESLQRISRRFDDNPAGFLLGREQPKEFQP